MDGHLDHTTLLRFQDAETSPEETARIKSHLAQCADCRERAKGFLVMEGPLRVAMTDAEVSTESCFDELDLASYAAGHPSDRLHEEITMHLAACGRCSAQLASLGRELAAAESAEPISVPDWVLEQARAFVPAKEVEPVSAVRERAAGPRAALAGLVGLLNGWLASFRARPAYGLAGAAALLLVLVLVLPPIHGIRDDAVERGGAPSELTVELLVPNGASLDAPPELSWSRVPGAVSYRVTIVDESGEFFWRTAATGTVLSVPDSAGLEPGRSYAWWVAALTAEGRRFESTRGMFELRP